MYPQNTVDTVSYELLPAHFYLMVAACLLNGDFGLPVLHYVTGILVMLTIRYRQIS